MNRSSLFKLSVCTAMFLLTNLSSAFAQNPAERIELERVLRQINLIQSTIKAQSGNTSSKNNRNRYYFDYQRLNVDLNRVKHGIHDYLQPKRAQPRDPVALSGEYRREAVQSRRQGGSR